MTKIEFLNYHSLSPGTHILGQIVKIRPLELVISLPNSLIGYVPITNISSQLSKIIECQNDDDSEDEDMEDAEKKDTPIPDLTDLFTLGQFVKTTVVSTASPYGGTSEKRHIELSIDPAQVNAHLNKEDLAPGVAVQGSVSSIEDHGLIIDIGPIAPSNGLSAFISNKELKPVLGKSMPNTSHIGQVLILTIASLSSNGRTLTLSCNPLSESVPLLTTVESIKTASAGVLVDATITEVRPNGIVVNVYDHAIGTISLVHIPNHTTITPTSPAEEGSEKGFTKEKFIIGDRLKARVISTLPHVEKGYHLSLSILPHILALQSPFTSGQNEEENANSDDPLEALPIGHIIENTKVVGVDLNRGVFADVHYNGLQGYVHISKLTDDQKPNALGPSLGPYRIGTVHRARILDYSYIDNLYKLSFQESVLKREFLNVAEIPIGATTQVTVSNILPTGDIVVNLADGIKGFIPVIYASDVKLHFPEKKYKVGSKVKARVSSKYLRKKNLTLSLKILIY